MRPGCRIASTRPRARRPRRCAPARRRRRRASVTVTIPVPAAVGPVQLAVTASTGLPTCAATAAAQAASAAGPARRSRAPPRTSASRRHAHQPPRPSARRPCRLTARLRRSRSATPPTRGRRLRQIWPDHAMAGRASPPRPASSALPRPCAAPPSHVRAAQRPPDAPRDHPLRRASRASSPPPRAPRRRRPRQVSRRSRGVLPFGSKTPPSRISSPQQPPADALRLEVLDQVGQDQRAARPVQEHGLGQEPAGHQHLRERPAPVRRRRAPSARGRRGSRTPRPSPPAPARPRSPRPGNAACQAASAVQRSRFGSHQRRHRPARARSRRAAPASARPARAARAARRAAAPRSSAW